MSSPFPCLHFPKLASQIVQSLLVNLLTHVSSSVIFGGTTFDSESASHQFRPSPLLVPVVPGVLFTTIVVDSDSDSDSDSAATLKAEQTLLAKYGEKLLRKFEGDICTVCLSSMKEDDVVREIRSCCHVFHRECLDTWIDIGKVTCPLCRCDLNPFPHLVTGGGGGGGGDPWRRERMIYLFGDDITF